MVRTFLRDWAVPCTWICLKAGITANQVTTASIVVAFVGAFMLTSFSPVYYFLGCVFLQLWYYLDHVDGQIARVSGTASLSGRFFDFIMHHAVHGIVIYCSGLFLVYFYDQALFAVLAGISAISIMVFNVCPDTEFKVFGEALRKQQGSAFVVFPNCDAASSAKIKAASAAKSFFSFIHKINEIHVVINVFTAVALASLWMDIFDLRIVLSVFYFVSPVFLAGVRVFYIVRNKIVDLKFQENFKNISGN